MSWVFPGFCEVIARPFFPVSMLMREDFPTLDRPMKAYSGRRLSGHLRTWLLLMTKVALLIIITLGGAIPLGQRYVIAAT